MQEILKLKPVFHDRIWGGTKLKEYFGYETGSSRTGECWAISAHKNGDCMIENGVYKGKYLSEVYRENRKLFKGSESPVFPLLVKLLETSESLSVQVHPDDEYALVNDDELGKAECWYIIDCEKDAEVVIGHKARTKDALIRMIDEGDFDHLLQRISVKPGDFFYIPSGTIHSVGEGIVLLEIEQSSDTTYRIYDYDRVDQDGYRRELQVEKAKDVANVLSTDLSIHVRVREEKNLTITRYLSTLYFTLEKWAVHGEAAIALEEFTLVSVIGGQGKINGTKAEKGDHFILTSLCSEAGLSGDLEIIACWIDRLCC